MTCGRRDGEALAATFTTRDPQRTSSPHWPEPLPMRRLTKSGAGNKKSGSGVYGAYSLGPVANPVRGGYFMANRFGTGPGKDGPEPVASQKDESCPLAASRTKYRHQRAGGGVRPGWEACGPKYGRCGRAVAAAEGRYRDRGAERAGSHCYGKPGHQKICGRYRRENIIDSIRNDRHVVWRGKRDPIRLGAVQWPEQYAGSAQPVYCGRRGAYSVGDTGGSDSVTLNVSHMPPHSHDITGNRSDGVNFFGVRFSLGSSEENINFTRKTGGGQSHENRPPYYALCFIMKTQ